MMLGARTAAWGSKAGLWNNPYVTDGLVMFVDPSISDGRFIDLVSGEGVEHTETIAYDFEKKAFAWSGDGSLEYPISSELNDVMKSANNTLELCLKIVPYTNTYYRSLIIAYGLQYSIITPRSMTNTNTYLLFNYYGRINTVISNALDSEGSARASFSLSCDATSLNGVKYKDGLMMGSATFTSIPTTDLTQFSTQLMNGAELYSMRMYSRVLADDEIAANYVVDKARFGIGGGV